MVHQYQLNGFNIVLDTCSGSVHAVDPVAYDAISLYETHSTPRKSWINSWNNTPARPM